MSEWIRRTTFKHTALLIVSLVAASCNNFTQVDDAQSRNRTYVSYSGTGKGKVYLSNPSVLAGKYVTRANYDDKLVAKFITDESTLTTPCVFTQYSPDFFDASVSVPYEDTTSTDCFNILNDRSASTDALVSSNNSWVYSAGTDEFYQVNTYYHTKLIMDRFLSSLSFSHKQVHLDGNRYIPPATKYNFVDTQSYWLHENGSTVNMDVFSKCYLSSMNAFFSPSDNQLCFGWNESDEDFFIVQDPTVIYHEMGHVFVKVMMNQRNITSGVDPNSSSIYYDSKTFSSDLGDISYDEAGALNEGIADWFSYYMVNRDQIGEYALYKLQGLARPVSEESDQHTISVSTETGERLSYPQYLQYNPASLSENVEDVHNAGTIVAHYLVALQKELKSSCSFESTKQEDIHAKSGDYIMLLLNETLAEVGDLTAKGSDFFSQYATVDSDYNDVYFTNLNEEHSFLWTQKVNPINFRRFFRIFAKNILYHISIDLCPEFTLDESEQLLDEYGLLLFNSYEDRGNGIDLDGNLSLSYFSFAGDHQLFSNRDISPVVLNTFVNEDNRRNSVLISKNQIELDDQITAYVFDKQTNIASLLAQLTFEGENVETTEGIAGTEYNNSNAKISPGEVVGISLNLYNKSNSTMAGVQILGNDWDHMKLSDSSMPYVNRIENINGLSSGDISGGIATHSPCIFDNFPKESEGGVAPDDESTTAAGNCNYITKTNDSIDTSEVVTDTHPKYDVDSPQPICLVQYSDEDETTWVSQDFYRKYSMGLEDKDCINNSSMSGNEFNPNSCLIRILPGAEHAILGKIDSRKTWAETIQGETNNSVTFSQSNIVVMEVNKWIPPGTKFNCRFRVRFSNCSDCYSESATDDEYADFEYAGAEPFKVINFQFEVLD